MKIDFLNHIPNKTKKEKMFKVINIFALVAFVLNMTALQSLVLALPAQADGVKGKPVAVVVDEPQDEQSGDGGEPHEGGLHTIYDRENQCTDGYGLKIVANGVGTKDASGGDIDLNVPGPISKAYLVWNGHENLPSLGDDTVKLNGTNVTGTLEYESASNGFASIGYRADVTSLVSQGDNTYTVSEMDFTLKNNGAGLIVVYGEPGADPSIAEVQAGLDRAHHGAPDVPIMGPDSYVWEFEFDAAPFVRTASFIFMVGGSDTRPHPYIRGDALWYQAGTGPAPTNLIDEAGATEVDYNFLDALDGPEWDTYEITLTVPAGATYAAFQIESPEDDHGESFSWVSQTLVMDKVCTLINLDKTDEEDPVQAGDNITYNITGSVEGNATAHNVVLADPIPDHTTYVSHTGPGTYYPGPNAVVWSFGDVDPGAMGSVQLVVQTESPIPGGMTVHNTATIDSDETDPVQATEDTEVIGQPILTLDKIDDQDPVQPGDNITYTISGTVEGNATAHNLTLADPIPDDTTYVSHTGPGVYKPGPNTVVWSFGDVNPGAFGSVELVVQTDSDLNNNTVIHNQAAIASDEAGPVLAEEDTTVIGECHLNIVKEVSASEANPGDTLTYTISYENVGNVNCTGGGVLVFDDLDDNLTYVDGTLLGEEFNGNGDGITLIGNFDGIHPLANAHVVIPGESGVITFDATVNEELSCGTTNIPNQAKIWSQEEGNVWSNEVNTEVTVACSLTVIKHVEGGTALASDWTMNIAGPENHSFAGSESGTTIDLSNSGTYTVTESGGPNNYTLSYSGDCDENGEVNISEGEEKTCTLTNTRDTGDFTVYKYDQLQQPMAGVELSVVGSEATVSDQTDDNGMIVFSDLPTDDYTVTETEPENYHFTSVSGDCSPDANPTNISLTTDNQSCTFTNARDTGEITVIKHVVGGGATASDWTMNIDNGGGTISFPGEDDPGTTNTVLTGDYQVTESGGPENYNLTYSGDCDENGYVTVGYNETKTCTLINTYVPVPEPGITLTKTIIDSDLVAGGYIDYELAYENTGNVTLTNVQIVDDYPEQYVTVTDAGGATDDGDTLTWSISNLEPGDSGTVSYTVSINSNTPSETDIENIATITSDQTEPVSDDETTQIPPAEVPPTPVLTIEKSVSADTIFAGDNLTYTINWALSGAIANKVTITDIIPNNTTFVSADNNGVYDSNVNTVIWSLGTKSAGDSGTVSMTVTTDSLLPEGSVITNVAVINSDETDPVSDDATTTIVSPTNPLLQITKDVSVDIANLGDTVTYTVVITNVGGADAINVVLDDLLPDNFTFVDGGGNTKSFALGDLAAGESVTQTYNVKIGDAATAGLHENNATAKADNHDPVSDIATLEVRIPTVLAEETKPELEITKEVNVPFANPGDLVEYTITVKNIGDGDAVNVVLSDQLPAGFTFVDTTEVVKAWELGNLAPEEIKTIIYSAKIADTTTAGNYENLAIVNADNADQKQAKAPLEVREPEVLGALEETGTTLLDYLYYLVGLDMLLLGSWLLLRNQKEKITGKQLFLR